MSKDENHQALTAPQAAVLLQFLQRTTLQGSEVPAYAGLYNLLSGIVSAAAEAESADAAPAA